MNYFLIGAVIALLALGVSGYLLGLATSAKVEKLEKKLKEKGILEDGWDGQDHSQK